MTWQEAYDNLNPQLPLGADDPLLLRGLFTPYIDDVKEELRLNRDKNAKILFSGHVGCGKSTFFNLLAKELENDFFVVKLMLKEFADPNDIDHIDILLGIALKCAEAAKDAGYKFDKPAVAQLHKLAKELAGLLVKQKVITKAAQQEIEGGAGIGLPRILSWFNAHFNTNFHLLHDVREQVRETYRPRISEFLEAINGLLISIRISAGVKYLLVLVDDSDKPRPAQRQRELFANAAEHLSNPKANIIYSVDASVSCHVDYKAVVNRFGGYQKFMPALRVVKPDRGHSPNPEKTVVMRELLRCRITDTGIADNAALEKIAYLGGGHVRETIRLCRAALFNARGTIGTAHVDKAVVELRNEFNFRGRETDVLRACLADTRWEPRTKEDEEAFFGLLAMSALLQYQNGTDKWYLPIPYLIPWLERHP